MNCVNCGYLLPSSNIKSCPLCGMKFPVVCISCGRPNPLYARFCFNCGAGIVKEEDGSSIQNFDVLVEKRKNVAVMFADVSGFTALSEKMDPEEVREIINDCFEYITKPIYQLEGTIDKYIGDCIMILFGARYSHGDDPRRAVMCALRMLDLIDEFSSERLSAKGLKLNLSIGINYGLVVTGSVGNYFDKDYTVMGDVVNTAQRLQSSADRGKIMVSESVYLETKDMIHYAGPWEITVKNKEKPVVCYSPSGFKIMEEYDDVVLVQRNTEINFLHSKYNKTRTTRCITVSGEAGTGKTTLIGKFSSQIEKDVKIIRVDCSSIYQNRVNYVMSSMLYGILNITPESLISIKKSRVLSYIGYILSDYEGEAIQKNYNFISLVMELERDKDFQDILNSMHYNDIEREVLNQLVLFFASVCKKNSYVFIVEDFQWADTSSKRILKQLIELLSEVRALFIFSVRNEAEGLEFMDRNMNDRMKLGPLDMTGTNELVCRMLNCSKIDKNFLEMIMKYTNGNPLYIKEFINSIKRKNHFFIKDSTAYIKESEIYALQDTVENIILSNFSDLDEGSTRFLQIAAVFGKEFNLSWVARLLNETSIEVNVSRLLQLNIITLKSVNTSAGKVEKIYQFTQDTVREVIYGSILNRSKKKLP